MMNPVTSLVSFSGLLAVRGGGPGGGFPGHGVPLWDGLQRLHRPGLETLRPVLAAEETQGTSYVCLQVHVSKCT